MKPERPATCGTRAVERWVPGTFRVVCATRGGVGSTPHRTRSAAFEAAVRDSAKPCPARPPCGAE